MTAEDTGRLLLSCPDRPGIVAAVSYFLFDRGANVIHSAQHSTEHGRGTLLSRIEFQLPDLERNLNSLEQGFKPIAGRFGMQWRLSRAAQRKRLAIFVSRAEHALLELLWQQRAGDLAADIVVVVSNHTTHADFVKSQGIPYVHIPVTAATKGRAEAQQLETLRDYRVDAVVLARYMQVLSADFLRVYPARIINIHHRHDADELRRLGRYIERVVLARAVGWHVEDRVLLHGNKTIVFT